MAGCGLGEERGSNHEIHPPTGDHPLLLPHLERAIVERRKVVEYLLNPLHPDGAAKAQFFMAAGFRKQSWQVMAQEFRNLVATHPVTTSLHNAHGWKYIVDGALNSPSGRTLRVRTVWIVDSGSIVPRLVTAYPVKE
jgi:hypothetical protein